MHFSLIFQFISISEKKKEAEAAIDLMTIQYERICSDEERRKGLIILHAQYGKFDIDKSQGMDKSLTIYYKFAQKRWAIREYWIASLNTIWSDSFAWNNISHHPQYRFTDASNDTSSSSTADHTIEEQNIDVTIPLQCLVKDSKLVLHNSSKVNITLYNEYSKPFSHWRGNLLIFLFPIDCSLNYQDSTIHA